MTPEQFDRFLESNERATGDAVEKFVNGKIDKMNTKLDTHIEKHDAAMETILPFIQGITGVKVFGKTLIWIAGLVVAYAAIKNFKL